MTASAEVGITTDWPVSAEARSSSPGLCPTRTTVVASTGSSRTRSRSSSGGSGVHPVLAANRRRVGELRRGELPGLLRPRRGRDDREVDDATCSASHSPASGAWRRPRFASGRSRSGWLPDQSDFACRSRISVRSGLDVADRAGQSSATRPSVEPLAGARVDRRLARRQVGEVGGDDGRSRLSGSRTPTGLSATADQDRGRPSRAWAASRRGSTPARSPGRRTSAPRRAAASRRRSGTRRRRRRCWCSRSRGRRRSCRRRGRRRRSRMPPRSGSRPCMTMSRGLAHIVLR